MQDFRSDVGGVGLPTVGGFSNRLEVKSRTCAGFSAATGQAKFLTVRSFGGRRWRGALRTVRSSRLGKRDRRGSGLRPSEARQGAEESGRVRILGGHQLRRLEKCRRVTFALKSSARERFGYPSTSGLTSTRPAVDRTLAHPSSETPLPRPPILRSGRPAWGSVLASDLLPRASVGATAKMFPNWPEFFQAYPGSSGLYLSNAP